MAFCAYDRRGKRGKNGSWLAVSYLSRSADCPQSAAAGLVENAASWDNSRSGFQLKIQIKTLPNGFGILVPVCQANALRFGTNRAPLGQLAPGAGIVSSGGLQI